MPLMELISMQELTIMVFFCQLTTVYHGTVLVCLMRKSIPL